MRHGIPITTSGSMPICQIIDPNAPPLEENPYQVGSRVASIFNSIYESMGDQQFSTLVRAIENGISADAGILSESAPGTVAGRGVRNCSR